MGIDQEDYNFKTYVKEGWIKKMWWYFFMAGLCLTVGLYLRYVAAGAETVAFLRGEDYKTAEKGRPWTEYLRPILPGQGSMNWAAEKIVQAGFNLTPELVWAGSYGGGLATAALVFAVNAVSSDPSRLFLLTVAGGLLGAAALPAYIWEKAKESREQRKRELLPLVQQLKVASASGVGTSYDALFAIADEDYDSLLAYDLRQARAAAGRGDSLSDTLPEVADRSGVKEFVELIETILDAEEKHVPLYKVLAGIENRMLNEIEVAASNAEAKSDDKLAIPLAAMLFPAYIIIIVGPGLLNVSKAFKF